MLIFAAESFNYYHNMKQNTLFSKESLRLTILYLDRASISRSTSALDNGPKVKPLHEAKWLVATIMDDVFDYDPYFCYVDSTERNWYPQYRQWLMEHTSEGIEQAVKEMEECLPNIKEDHSFFSAKGKKQHVIQVFREILKHEDEIVTALQNLKKEKKQQPSAEEIDFLLKTLYKYHDEYEDSIQESFVKSYIWTLALAWQFYGYGSVYDCLNGDFYFYFDPLIVVQDTADFLGDYILGLNDNSPFMSLENGQSFTARLLAVFKTFVNEDIMSLETEVI